jgi:hypothetical protein
MSMIQDPLFFDPEYKKAMEKYLEEYWWSAVHRDPTQFDYWRITAQKRMGKFKIVRSEGQEVLEE